ncbi:hypothetical protein AAV99_09470 [Aurantiacibacter marinus]|uniref:Uncharacterized protein n=2 Tax=Aurantiacibacter marinus TaxID=874156 RepID=A0A0H0XMV5_9SPHN|nr:hypothetical protein AAV99_09470 [Aurantiacibacter marinus]
MLDFLFILLGAASFVMLFGEGFDTVQPISPSSNPPLMGGVLLVGVIVLSWAITLTSKIDRRRNDECVFQAMVNAAFVAVLVTLVASILLDFAPLLGSWMVKPSEDVMVGVLMASWATAYAINRMRGTIL